MKREASLARSLMLSLTSALIVFWLIAIGIGIQVMREEYDEVFDSALEETGERLLSVIAADLLSRQTAQQLIIELDNAPRGAYLTYQVRKADGTLVLKSNNAQLAPFDVPLKAGFADTPRYRIYTAVDTDGQLFLHVTDRFSHRREAVRESAAAMLIPLIVLIPGSFIVIWFIVGRAARPIEMLRETISTKDSGNLALIASIDMPRELKPIVRSVNLLLERLRVALDAEREFTANSAHELRTPIAGALGHCQMLIRELPESPSRQRAKTVEDALLTLGRLAEKLLQLSRADSGIGTTDNAVDLLGLLDLIVRDFERTAKGRDQIIYNQGNIETLKRHVDADAFALVMRNIIENALIHRASKTPITISVKTDGQISVINDCPVLSENDLILIRKRFQRGKTQASGSGIGLSIADKIVTQMGGNLVLHSPPLGQVSGFEAIITL